MRKLKRKTKKIEVPIISLYDNNNHRLEQFQTLKNNIGFSASTDQEIKSLAITSAGPAEGKSTVSANLAMEFVASGKRVLIIDADFRRPTLHNTFSLLNSSGLYTLVTNTNAEVEEIINKTSIDGLDILTSGVIIKNASKFFESENFTNLLKKLETQYDLVLIDTPPVQGFADTPMIAAKVDGIAIVVQEGKSRKREFMEMLSLLQQSNANILGVVYLEEPSKSSHYNYYY